MRRFARAETGTCRSSRRLVAVVAGLLVAPPGKSMGEHDLGGPIKLPPKATLVPKGHAPADPRGVQKRLASLRYLPSAGVTGASYFNGGIAFHGYPDVPAQPASHGCIRLPAAEAPYAYTFMSLRTRVSVD